MRKLKLTELINTYLGSGLLLTASGYIVSWYLSGDVAWPIVVGFGVPALTGGLGLAARLRFLTAPDSKYLHPGSRAIPYTSSTKSGNIFLSAVNSIFAEREIRSNRTQQSVVKDEFCFYECNMSAIIYESKLYRFCCVAWRRQRLFAFGELGSNQVLSRNHFCDVYPRLATAEYDSIIHILRSRSLLDGGRWQGKGGYLRYSPGITVEEAKRRW